MTSKKSVLITGAQGYLGTKLNNHLVDKGYNVNGIDTGTFKACNLGSLPKESNIITLDSSSLNLSNLKGIDAVIDLASNSNDPTSMTDDLDYYMNGIKASSNLARLCKENGVRYIFPSSCSIYGSTLEICKEESPPRPLTAYSKSKVIIEEELSRLSDEAFSPVALRLGTVFGYSPRMRFDIVINMFAGMLLTNNRIALNSNGKAWRPHLYIDDVLRTIESVLDGTFPPRELTVLNVGNEKNNLTILEAAIKMAKYFAGSSVSTSVGELSDLHSDKKVKNGVDARNYQVSFKKIRSMFPTQEKFTGFEQGFLQLVSDLKECKLSSSDFFSKKFYRLQYLSEENRGQESNQILK